MAIVSNICRHQMRNNSFCVIFCLKMQITIESKKSCTVIHRNIFPNSGRSIIKTKLRNIIATKTANIVFTIL